MNTEITEKSILSADNYEELLKLLTCNDEGSITMALTILEQSDYEKSEVYILCIMKNVYDDLFKGSKSSKLESDYPVLFTNINTRLRDQATDVSTLSFRKIFEITRERNITEELIFMLDVFRDDLKILLEEFGFEFVKDLEVVLRPIGFPDPRDQKIAELEEQLAKYKLTEV